MGKCCCSVQVLHPDFGMAAPACRPPAASPTEPTEDVILHKLRLCSDAGLLKVCSLLYCYIQSCYGCSTREN